MTEEEKLLTMEEAIMRLSTTRGTLYRWLRSGQLNGFKIGRQWRFTEAEIERFLSGAEPEIDLPASPDELIGILAQALDDAELMKRLADKPAVQQIVDLILICGLRKGASTLFLDQFQMLDGDVESQFTLRIDGLIHTIAKYDGRLHQPIVDRLKQMCSMDVTEKRVPQDGRMKMKLSADHRIDFRVSTMPTLWGESCAMLVQDPQVTRIGFDTLGLSGRNLERVQATLKRKQGLYIASGPSESGKQVTAYSLVNALDKGNSRIVSIEEPGSVSYSGVIQTVTSDTLTLPTMIRASSRQNWDVLNVGYIPDAESLSLSMHEALSGQVITTMHLRDAVSGLVTIRDWGAEGLLLGDTVALILSQRLVRRLCPLCRASAEPGSDELDFVVAVGLENGLAEEQATELASSLWVPAGCDQCHDGFKGRIAIFEALVPDNRMQSLLLEGANHEELQREAIASGMTTVRLDGIYKASEGVTSLREVRRVTSDLSD